MAIWMFIFIISIRHANADVGVKVGDYVEYMVDVKGVFELAELNYVKAEVKEIVGTQVTELITFRYKNGTSTSETRTVDTSTEADFVTSAYLNIGDSRVVKFPGERITINKILNRDYYGVSREVAYFNQTEPDRVFQGCYDRKTGFLLEMYYWLSEFGVEVHHSFRSTNLWQQTQQYPSLTVIIKWIQEHYMYIILAIIVILILCYIVFKTRRRHKLEQI